MVTLQITLPDQLAQEAERAGLLSSPRLERWLREQLQHQFADELFAAAERMASVEEPQALSAEEIAFEMQAMRAQHRFTSPSK